MFRPLKNQQRTTPRRSSSSLTALGCGTASLTPDDLEATSQSMKQLAMRWMPIQQAVWPHLSLGQFLRKANEFFKKTRTAKTMRKI